MNAFGLTPEQRSFTEHVRALAAEQLRPIAEAGTPGRVNRELIKAMGDLGLLTRLFGDWESREAAATDWESREAAATDWESREAAATDWESREAAATDWESREAAATDWESREAAATDWESREAAATDWESREAAATDWESREAAATDWESREAAATDWESREAAATDLCLLRESLATQSTEAETALALQGLGAYPILQSGLPETVRRWLPAVAAGDAVPSFALTEPEAGSDAAALALTAERDGDGWRLTGEKIWISNAPEADVYTVFARTAPDAGARGVSAFVVPGDRPGLSGEHLDMISPHPIGRLIFDGVRVEATELLGELDRGFRVAMRTLDLFRPSVGAFAVGMAQAAIDAAVQHAGTRIAFGGPLKDQQAVSHLLAEMATRTEAARLLVYAAAGAYDAGSEEGWGGAQAIRGGIAAKSAMAKLFATETAQFVVDAAVQIHGARALRQGHLLEHLYREVRAPRIYEGASEVQRTIIARELYR